MTFVCIPLYINIIAVCPVVTVIRRRAGVHVQQREFGGRRDLLRQGDRLQRRQTLYNVRQ